MVMEFAKLVLDEYMKVGLGEETICFLSTVGLPKSAPLNVAFLAVPRIHKQTGLCEIGSDEENQICLEHKTDRVVSVACNGKVRLINSKVALFVELLQCYCSYASQVQELDDNEAETFAQQTVQQMIAVDEPAFENPDDWWPSVSQQMEHGLL